MTGAGQVILALRVELAERVGERSRLLGKFDEAACKLLARIADGAGAMQVPERAVTRRARRRLSTVEATSTGVTEA